MFKYCLIDEYFSVLDKYATYRQIVCVDAGTGQYPIRQQNLR